MTGNTTDPSRSQAAGSKVEIKSFVIGVRVATAPAKQR